MNLLALSLPFRVGMTEKLDSVAATAGAAVQVLFDGVRVNKLTINRPSISAYLQTIDVEKQEIALVHALEVGVAELAARRERVRK